MINDKLVSLSSLLYPVEYPNTPPFYPNESFPELSDRVLPGKERNLLYELMRDAMLELGLDASRFSTPEWNPLGVLITPGDKVLVKPNLVRHLHLTGGDFQAIVTHGSLIRCVLDYVGLALKGRGEITVGDAPIQSADFSKLVQRTGLEQVCADIALVWKIPVKLVDFRLSAVDIDENHHIIDEYPLSGDPLGYSSVNLGSRSLLRDLDRYSDRFRVTSYDCQEMKKHHNAAVHEYLIPRTVLDADVVINLPKLKTHRKVGLTAALKNIVGINGHKDWLPHHRIGAKQYGGDEYLEPSFLKSLSTYLNECCILREYPKLSVLLPHSLRLTDCLARSLAPDLFSEGSWYGNDTLWRTVLDLNRLLIYADRQARMRELPQRKCITFVDAVIAGEGEGPVEPTSRQCGFLAAGVNPVAIDAVLATMVGFDFRRIPLIAKAFEIEDWPLCAFEPAEIEVRSRDMRWHGLSVGKVCTSLKFSPPSGWKNHIEFGCQTHKITGGNT